MAFAPPSPAPLRARRALPAPRSVTRRALAQRCRPRMTRADPAAANTAAADPAAPPAVPAAVSAFLSRAAEGRPLASLAAAERSFFAWKAGAVPVPSLVRLDPGGSAGQPTYDVVVAGGTLGIFFAGALAARGLRVAVAERGALAGRAQEWNVSRDELDALARSGALEPGDVGAGVVREFAAPARVGLAGRDGPRALGAPGALSAGVNPQALVAAARARFEARGGAVLEHCKLEGARVCRDGVALTLRPQQRTRGALGAGGAGTPGGARADAEPVQVTARLLVDAMGSFSPIAAQARGGASADGVCVTVGSCVRGPFAPDDGADLLFAAGPLGQSGPQRFWEAFPAGRAGDARTTYLFSYGPCDSSRTTLTAALEEYVRLAPGYLGTALENVEVQRVLFGFFPCFRDSPARLAFDRVLPVGDAAGFQSPVSFGGFASCLRHLERVTSAVAAALSAGDDSLLQREELQRMQFYNPSLSVAWLFNKAMAAEAERVRKSRFLDEFAVNDLLWANMDAMRRLGPGVQQPFLQDIVRADGLTLTLLLMTLSNPSLALKTVALVGGAELVEWARHYLALVAFTAAAPVAEAVQYATRKAGVSALLQFRIDRTVDMLRYGAGLDFHES